MYPSIYSISAVVCCLSDLFPKSAVPLHLACYLSIKQTTVSILWYWEQKDKEKKKTCWCLFFMLVILSLILPSKHIVAWKFLAGCIIRNDIIFRSVRFLLNSGLEVRMPARQKPKCPLRRWQLMIQRGEKRHFKHKKRRKKTQKISEQTCWCYTFILN